MNNISHNNSTSPLYNLQPIGIGTPYVESLSSYIKRLAEAHSVSLGILLSREIIPSINKNYLKKEHFIGEEGKRRNFNTFSSDLVQKIIHILQNKTCNNNLPYLTMETWFEFFNNVNTFRKTEAWCPICYEESKLLKQPIYQQLIWSFSSIEICRKHKIRLIEKCPHCGSKFGQFNSLSRVGFCDRCHTWLGFKSIETSTSFPVNAEWHNWIYDNVGQLLCKTPPILNEEIKMQFGKNIKYIIDAHNMSMRRLEEIINVSHGKVRLWISGVRPTLNDVLILSYKFGYSVEGLLTKDIRDINCVINSYTYSERIITKNIRIKKESDINEIKKTMDRAIANNKVLSLQKLSTDFKTDKYTIKKYLPEEVVKLQMSNDKVLKERKLIKLKLIKDTMIGLHQKGIFPSGKALKREFGKRVLINDDEKKVWLETLEELEFTIE